VNWSDKRPFPRHPRLPADAYVNREATFHIVMRAFPETTPFTGPLRDAIWAFLAQMDSRPDLVPIAACLMPDHLHLLAKPGVADLRDRIAAVKSYTTTLARPFTIRRLWQPSFYDHRIRDEQEFESVLHYVRYNPVQAELVSEPEEWPFTKIW
jgi:REP element-mobilizing transposase RayT